MNRCVVLLVSALSLAACGGVNGSAESFTDDSGDEPPSQEGSGTIEVTTSTTNPSPGLTYTVTISNGQKQTIPAAGSVAFMTHRTGGHDVALSGVPANCDVAGDNPQRVTVQNGLTVIAAFSVTCNGGSLVHRS